LLVGIFKVYFSAIEEKNSLIGSLSFSFDSFSSSPLPSSFFFPSPSSFPSSSLVGFCLILTPSLNYYNSSRLPAKTTPYS